MSFLDMQICPFLSANLFKKYLQKTTEGNKLQFATPGTAIHRPAKSRVTTMNHLLDVLDDSVARVKGVNHFFIVIGKDFLEDIHMISMREMKEKENPDSPHE